jgi:hypothetical protein
MKRKLASITALGAVVVAAAATVPAGAAGPPSANAALREFEGTVVGKNVANRNFRLRDTDDDTSFGTVRIHVNRNTRYERVNGLRGLRVGARNIEAVVRKRNGRWIALEVERSGRDDRSDDRDDDGRDDDRGGDDNDDDNSGPGSDD